MNTGISPAMPVEPGPYCLRQDHHWLPKIPATEMELLQCVRQNDHSERFFRLRTRAELETAWAAYHAEVAALTPRDPSEAATVAPRGPSEAATVAPRDPSEVGTVAPRGPSPSEQTAADSMTTPNPSPAPAAHGENSVRILTNSHLETPVFSPNRENSFPNSHPPRNLQDLDETGRQTLLAWLEHHTYAQTLEKAAQPLPEGLNLRTSIPALSRFYQTQRDNQARQIAADLAQNAAQFAAANSKQPDLDLADASLQLLKLRLYHTVLAAQPDTAAIRDLSNAIRRLSNLPELKPKPKPMATAAEMDAILGGMFGKAGDR